MINFQALLTMAEIVEQTPERQFSMTNWGLKDLRTCGTPGCMAGHYAAATGNTQLIAAWNHAVCEDVREKPTMVRLAEHFGISVHESEWLFGDCALKATIFPGCELPLTNPRSLHRVSKAQALGRLRKFIYYKLHKREMSLDEQRRAGHVGFAQRASKAAHFHELLEASHG